MAKDLDLQILLKAKDMASREIKGVSKSLEGMETASRFTAASLGRLAGTLGLALGAKELAEAAWEMGKLGAQSLDTKSAFDSMLRSVGQSPALLQKMKQAAGGTVAELKLMQGVNLALAGTSGELAAAMANAQPKMLEVARAAYKMNPALGSVEFLYQSLNTGIKRNSKMLIDNLGIVVSATEAQAAYATKIGTTVDKLTDQQKQIALLDAVVGDAGQTLIDQVGGVKAMGDEFAKLNTSLADTKAWLGELIAPVILKGLEILNSELEILAARRVGDSGVANALRDQANVSKEYQDALVGLAGAERTLAGYEEELTTATGLRKRILEAQIPLMQEQVLKNQAIVDGHKAAAASAQFQVDRERALVETWKQIRANDITPEMKALGMVGMSAGDAMWHIAEGAAEAAPNVEALAAAIQKTMDALAAAPAWDEMPMQDLMETKLGGQFARGGQIGVLRAAQELEDAKTDIATQGAWDRAKLELDSIRDTSAQAIDVWEKAHQTQRSTIKSIMSTFAQPFDGKSMMDQMGRHIDTWDENRSRMIDVANLGFGGEGQWHDKLNEMGFIPDEVLQGGEEVTIAFAANWVLEFDRGEHPEAIDMEALERQIQEAVDKQANWEQIYTTVQTKLGLSDTEMNLARGIYDPVQQTIDASRDTLDKNYETIKSFGSKMFDTIMEGVGASSEKNDIMKVIISNVVKALTGGGYFP